LLHLVTCTLLEDQQLSLIQGYIQHIIITYYNLFIIVVVIVIKSYGSSALNSDEYNIERQHSSICRQTKLLFTS